MTLDARLSGLATEAFDSATNLAFFNALLNQTALAVLVLDDSNTILWANPAFTALTGFAPETVQGWNAKMLNVDGVAAAFSESMSAMAAGPRLDERSVTYRRADGGRGSAILDATKVTAPTGESYVIATLMRTLGDDVNDRGADIERALVHEVVAESSDGLMVIDSHGTVVFCNPAAGTLFNRNDKALLGSQFGFPFSPGEDWTSLEFVRNGQPAFVDMRTAPIVWQGADATLATLRDVTERHEIESIVAMQLKAMESAANGIFVTDAQGKFKWVNDAFCKLCGHDEEELLGRSAKVVKSTAHDDDFFADMWTTISNGNVWQGQIVNRHKDGHFYTADQTITPIHDKAGRLTHFVSIQEDISERLKAQADLVHMAEFDTLTDLPNRHLFMDRLKSAIERAARANVRVAVMVMDLDNFKDINNTLGHDVGDQLIVTVTERIKGLMRTTDTMARLGGDEFGILLEHLTDMNAASRMVRRILETFDEPIGIGGKHLKVTASIGIAAYPEDDDDPLNLLRHAELAMYRVKAEGRHSYQYFDQAMDDEIRKRVSLEADLRNAVEKQQLWLAYQPQVDLQTGSVIGAEALLRWNHPDLGFISPGEFIPIAEQSGLILPIGDWIIDEICRQTAAWRHQGLPAVQMGINISGHQFKHRELSKQVLQHLTQHDLDIDALDLEITETVAMERTKQVTTNVDQLVEAGFSISMDDFGTGYSSLSNLQAFPVRRLKVDGSFVRGIGTDRDDEKIVEAVIGLGHSLGLCVIAEGVETHDQVSFLKELKCNEIQGYLVSKPLPAVEFEAFLKDRAA